MESLIRSHILPSRLDYKHPRGIGWFAKAGLSSNLSSPRRDLSDNQEEVDPGEDGIAFSWNSYHGDGARGPASSSPSCLLFDPLGHPRVRVRAGLAGGVGAAEIELRRSPAWLLLPRALRAGRWRRVGRPRPRFQQHGT